LQDPARPGSNRVAMSAALLGALWSASAVSPAHAQDSTAVGPTVVLVHGAFADGSSWSRVIPLLQAEGLHVVAVQNPLSSLADDVDAVTRVLEAQTGPVVLGGHSWGGTVISQAGNNDKVAALVYIAAFAPDDGQSTNATQANYPVPVWVPLLIADSAGFVTLPEDAVLSDFAQDLSPAKARVIAATQGPLRGSALDETVTHAAWHDHPTWYVVADQDRMIDPALEAQFAATMGAKTTHLDTSHLPFLSRPRQTAAVILDAVQAVKALAQ
jgi:pimeloyl-ACP methyl ester carboxylesterase